MIEFVLGVLGGALAMLVVLAGVATRRLRNRRIVRVVVPPARCGGDDKASAQENTVAVLNPGTSRSHTTAGRSR